jgi:hypothetical protein
LSDSQALRRLLRDSLKAEAADGGTDSAGTFVELLGSGYTMLTVALLGGMTVALYVAAYFLAQSGGSFFSEIAILLGTGIFLLAAVMAWIGVIAQLALGRHPIKHTVSTIKRRNA